jgi:hypothetical protein
VVVVEEEEEEEEEEKEEEEKEEQVIQRWSSACSQEPPHLGLLVAPHVEQARGGEGVVRRVRLAPQM